MDLVASKARKKSADEVKNKTKQTKKPHRAFPSLLLALNGFILPAANLCFMEIYLPFSFNDNYYISLSFTGEVHGMAMGKPHALLARSCIASEVF